MLANFINWVKNHWGWSALIFVLSAIGITWGVAIQLRVEPLKDHIEYQKTTISDLERKLKEAKSSKDLLPVLDRAAKSVGQIEEREPTPFKMNYQIIPDGEFIDVQFHLEETITYPTGKYQIEQAYEFTNFVGRVKKFLDMVNEASDGRILEPYILFEGSADNRSVDSQAGTHGGPTVVIDEYEINGEYSTSPKIIRNGQQISNAEIALLRGHGVQETFMAMVRNRGLSIKAKTLIVATEFFESGPSYRFGKVTVRLNMENVFKRNG